MPIVGKIFCFIFDCVLLVIVLCVVQKGNLKDATHKKRRFLFLLGNIWAYLAFKQENISANLSSDHRFHLIVSPAACVDTTGNAAYWKHLYWTSSSEVRFFFFLLFFRPLRKVVIWAKEQRGLAAGWQQTPRGLEETLWAKSNKAAVTWRGSFTTSL